MEGVRWDELPPELLPAISGGLQNPVDVIRMRSVCRLWRFTIPRPPYKLCQYFPITADPKHTDVHLLATAVYLLRSRSDPNKAWMISVQETGDGKLLARQPLTHQKIISFSGFVLDLSEFSTVTRLSPNYGITVQCLQCKQWCSSPARIIFVDWGRSDEKVCLARKYGDDSPVIAFRIGSSMTINDVAILDQYSVQDFIRFNGRIYGVDKALQLHIFDTTDLVLRTLPIPTSIGAGISVEEIERSYTTSFVESEGDLYVVLKPTHGCRVESGSGLLGPRVCKVVWDDRNQVMSGCRLELVQDLGDRVFFVSRDTSFSVSSLDLPSPWQGNYVVHPLKETYSCCACWVKDERIGIYHIGAGCDQWLNFSYCDLFNPYKMKLGSNSLSSWIVYAYDFFH